jgi:hypothetical protein
MADMSVRPSQLWKNMPIERRLAAAEAFWQDENGAEQQIEAVVAIAQKLKFRPRSVQTQPLEKKARQLAHISDVSETIATRALIAHHLTSERPMMSAFLDALGIAHDNGLISADETPAQSAEAVAAASKAIADQFPADRVSLYLNTLLTQDPDTWGALDGLPQLALDVQ